MERPGTSEIGLSRTGGPGEGGAGAAGQAGAQPCVP